MDVALPFAKVIEGWLADHAVALADLSAKADAAVEDPASVAYRSPILQADVRSVAAGFQPRGNPRQLLSFLLEIAPPASAQEQHELYAALGIRESREAQPPSLPPLQRLLESHDPMPDGVLDDVWQDALHAGIKLAVAMRRQGMDAGTSGRAQLLDALGPDIGSRPQLNHKLKQFIEGDAVPIFSGEMLERLGHATHMTPPQQQEFEAQYHENRAATEERRLRAVKRRAEGSETPEEVTPPAEPAPRVVPLKIAQMPAPLRIPPEALAERIEQYAAEMGEKLRPPQQQALADIAADLRKGNIGGVIKRPTGSGKTVIFSTVIAALKDLAQEMQQTTGEQHSLLVLVPNTLLEDQTVETLTHKRDQATGLPFLHKPGHPDAFAIAPEDVVAYSDQDTAHQKTRALAKPVIVMTFSAYESKLNRREFEPNQAMYAVIDEVDTAKDARENEDKRTDKIRRLTTGAYSHGYSATTSYVSPTQGHRTINETLYDRAADDYVHVTRIRSAAEAGEVSPIKNVLLMTHINTEAERESGHEYASGQLDRIVNASGRDDAIIKKVLEYTDTQTGLAFKDLDQIWFCKGVAHAHRIADQLNAVMHAPSQYADAAGMAASTGGAQAERGAYPFAMAIDGTMPEKSWRDKEGTQHWGRKDILRLHREGKIPVLCTADLLVRGFDSPRTQLAVMTYPSMSPAKVEQIGGRIGRIDPENAGKVGFMVNVIDEDTRRARIFSDKEIAEVPFIGTPPPAGSAAARPLLDGHAPRQPDFAVLNQALAVSEIRGRDMEMVADPDMIAQHIRAIRERITVQKKWYTKETIRGMLQARELPTVMLAEAFSRLEASFPSGGDAAQTVPMGAHTLMVPAESVRRNEKGKIQLSEDAVEALIAATAAVFPPVPLGYHGLQAVHDSLLPALALNGKANGRETEGAITHIWSKAAECHQASADGLFEVPFLGKRIGFSPEDVLIQRSGEGERTLLSSRIVAEVLGAVVAHSGHSGAAVPLAVQEMLAPGGAATEAAGPTLTVAAPVAHGRVGDRKIHETRARS